MTRTKSSHIKMEKLVLSVLCIFLVSSCSNKSQQMSQHKYTNKLIEETSPYLLQHAHNPVDWHPWGEEALQKAQQEDKLLIISVGYAACHWCHVMEHESFEDTTVAEVMNAHFVPIKVDREERPDVDDIYMTACNIVSGRGGWPLNAIALPDGRPIWAGTYFPKSQWLNILNQISAIHRNQPERLEEAANKITQGIRDSDDLALVEEELLVSKNELEQIADNFLSKIDFELGGRVGAPKFPMPNNYEFLLLHHHHTNHKKSLDAVTKTLDAMAQGGIYDQIGGGFARYSVDAQWFAPHFEKMLYDNGQLVSLYAKAFQLTNNEEYKRIVYQTIEFVERELSDVNGGFYSSLDADSEGEEGKFYVWTQNEIDLALADDEELSQLAHRIYNTRKNGNWEGNNILFRTQSDKELATRLSISTQELRIQIDQINQKLLLERSHRIRPGLDDKILTSWNALMCKGYVDAYIAFGEEDLLDRAIKNAQFIINKQYNDGRLNRNYKNGKSNINGFLDDYALTMDAFIRLYEATFDEKWLTYSQSLMDYTIKHFFKSSNSMFNYTSDIDPPLVARKSELGDNVIPGSNSMMARVLLKLGDLLYQKEYLNIGKQMLTNLKNMVVQSNQPSFYSNWCQLLLDQVHTPYEIAIVGPSAELIRKQMMQNFTGNAIFLGATSEGNLELLKGKFKEGQTLIYVCKNKSCKLPTSDIDTAMSLME